MRTSASGSCTSTSRQPPPRRRAIMSELNREHEGLAKLGTMLALVVEDALRPALEGKRVRSCLHVMDEIYRDVRPRGQAASDRMVLICPMHPGRLLCDAPPSEHGWRGCATSHLMHDHGRESVAGSCFV